MNYLSDEEAVFVIPPDNAEARRARVLQGDVLLTITGSRIGRVTSIREEIGEAYVSQHVAILRLDNQFTPDFISMFLSMEGAGQYQINKMQYGQTKPGLNLEQIRKFRVPLIPMKLQKEFENKAEGISNLKMLQSNCLKHIDEFFQSLQQRAFIGELFTEQARATTAEAESLAEQIA